MKISKAQEILDGLIPSTYAESWDNVGLIVGDPTQELQGILVSLDITLEVMQEAIEKKCNLIITHHPIWFRPKSRLIDEDFSSRMIQFAIKNDLSLYAYHTNLDNISKGVNDQIVKLLELREVQFLDPKADSPDNQGMPLGSGMIGNFDHPLEIPEFLELVKNKFHTSVIRYTAGPKNISRVAVCGGSGGFLLEKAIQAGADAFITGDITYHRFFDPMQKIMLLDIGHFESEQFSTRAIESIIRDSFGDHKIRVSGTNTNPVLYF